MNDAPKWLKYWQSLTEDDWEKIEFLAKHDGDENKAKWGFIKSKITKSKVDKFSDVAASTASWLVKQVPLGIWIVALCVGWLLTLLSFF